MKIVYKQKDVSIIDRIDAKLEKARKVFNNYDDYTVAVKAGAFYIELTKDEHEELLDLSPNHRQGIPEGSEVLLHFKGVPIKIKEKEKFYVILEGFSSPGVKAVYSSLKEANAITRFNEINGLNVTSIEEALALKTITYWMEVQ